MGGLGGPRQQVPGYPRDALRPAAVADVVVIDLVLNWSRAGDEVLRVVRLESSGFDPRMVFEAPDPDADPLAAFRMELMARSEATPLPDPESALGLNVRACESLRRYELEVLQVES